MRPVRDEDGNTYLPVNRSADAWLVRDPDTGESRYVDADRLEPVEDGSPLEAAASGVEEPVRRLFALVHDERSLGLLYELADRGPLPVRTMLADYDFCESDIHGRLASWRAGGLVEEADVHGERGYRLTESCERALWALRKRFDNRSAAQTEESPASDGRSSADAESTAAEPGRDVADDR